MTKRIIIEDVTVEHETRDALLVHTNFEKAWVPKSKAEVIDGDLHIEEWLAIDKGLV